MIIEIKDLSDVEAFTKELIKEGVNAHPDEDFNNYVDIETHLSTYTVQEASIRNDLMDKCFEICETYSEDIYIMMNNIYLEETGLDKFIPKS
jgi:hypothetical protein